jgi:hypothetical protein
MATLQEIYQKAVKLSGPDSAAAKAIKQQIESEALSKGQSAERFFIASFQKGKVTPKAAK